MAHIPVLLNETLELLCPRPGEFIIDGTANGGGHLEAIIEKMGKGRVMAVEWDREVIEATRRRFEEQSLAREVDLIWTNDNYANIPRILEANRLPKANGLLLDLGFSTEQLESQKGFSYLKGQEGAIDEPLDMRYDRHHGGETAAEIINGLREEELSDLIFTYGEERFSRYIAKGIVEARKSERIITVSQLVRIIRKSVPRFFKKGEMDVVSRTFQAIRIYVNREFENIEAILRELPEIVEKEGRVVVISFHSLEDRIIKKHFSELEKRGTAKLINKKPVGPKEEEIRANPRSRSAKVRAIEII